LTPEQSKPERRISGRTFLIILLVGAILGVALVGGSIYLNGAPTGTASLTGSLLISSSGSLGAGSSGSTTVTTYNVTLAAISGSGTMNLTLSGRSDDLLQQHEFLVTKFSLSPNNLTLTFSGASVNLGWINNNTVWKSLNDTYLGASGQSAPAGQTWGSITATDFPGVPSGYYVVLSVSITSQPTNNIPFLLAPVARTESTPP
jgi:hypothetical protein